VWKVLAFVLPLGLDSFAVAGAIGAIRATTVPERLRITLIFVLELAEQIAGIALILLGAYLVVEQASTKQASPYLGNLCVTVA
jgi:putative Mn2+ efflux pump MntP